jgi:hypothetical protein
MLEIEKVFSDPEFRERMIEDINMNKEELNLSLYNAGH